MEPEIARRCLNCGAAVRGHARFCPQCGLSMSEAPTLAPPAVVKAREGSGRLVDEAERVARQLNDSLPSTPAPPLSAEAHSGTVAEIDARADAPTAAAHDGNAEPARGALAERAEALRARAGERVERLREASIVVLDEAHDDPALRFVLVAAALFVLFLLILLFSHILS